MNTKGKWRLVVSGIIVGMSIPMIFISYLLGAEGRNPFLLSLVLLIAGIIIIVMSCRGVK